MKNGIGKQRSLRKATQILPAYQQSYMNNSVAEEQAFS